MALRPGTSRVRGTASIPTRFSEGEIARVDRAQARLGLRSRSAFIRDAVMEKVHALETSKIVEVRDVSEKEAIRLIDRYLNQHPGVHYTSDIADEIGIDLPVAFAAMQRIIDRGRARIRRE